VAALRTSAVSATYGPIPVRLMLCGLVGSLPTLTATFALSGVGPTVGVNVAAIMQVELRNTVPPHLIQTEIMA